MAARRVRPAEFRRSLTKAPPGPAYLFSGPELLLKRQAIEALVELVPEGARPLNVEIFHAFEADLAAVLGAAKTIPFLAPRRVVVLRDIDKMRLSEGRGDLLEEYLKEPAPETTLVVTTEVDEKARDLGKRFGEGWTEVVFAALAGAELEERIRQEAERLGCAILPGGVTALLEATGADLARALGELGKLRLAVGAGGTVGEEEVARLVAGYDYQTLDDLLRAVSARDLGRSLRLLAKTVPKQEQVLHFMGLLGKRLRVLWYFADTERPLPPSVKIWPARPEDLRAWGRRFSRREIERGLLALLEVDAGLKGSGSVPPRLLLEGYLIAFLGPAGARAATRPGGSGR